MIKFTVLVGFLLLIGMAIHQPDKPATMPSGLPVVAMPDGAGDYHSAQLDAETLETVLESGAINAVIRLNADSDILTPQEEWEICNRYDVEFYRFDAHNALDRASMMNILNQKNTLVHCRHGQHRTGAVVGQYLLNKGYKKAEIIAHLGWENYNRDWPGKYREYYDIATTHE